MVGRGASFVTHDVRGGSGLDSFKPVCSWDYLSMLTTNLGVGFN